MQYNEKIGYKSNAMIKPYLESIEYYPFHLHDDALEIICVLNGTVNISDSAANYTLTYGDIHIFNKNDPHMIFSEDPSNILLRLQINTDYYSRHFSDLNNFYFICDTYSDRELYSFDVKYLRFQLARLYYEYSGSCSDIKLENYTIELINYLKDYFSQYIYKEESDKTANIVRLKNTDYLYTNYERLYRIVDYVYANYHKKLYLKDIADREYLSEEHLCRYIKKTLGLSFSQLISLTRCEEAARLLSSTKKTVDQISEQVGFSNRKQLAVQFQKWYRQTPSQYRNRILKDLNSNSKILLRPFDYQYAKTILDMYIDE